MKVLRSILFECFFYLWTALFLVGLMILLPLPRWIMGKGLHLWSAGLQLGLRLLVGLKSEIRGREHIPSTSAIFASKHQSAWDTFVFFELLNDPSYVMKKELAYVPLWGLYVWKTGSIFIDRAAKASALKSMVRNARDAVARGQNIIMFPEGTRATLGKPSTYHPGVAALYRQIDVPVIPIAVNSGYFWSRGNSIKQPGTIVLEFLPPMPTGLKRRDFMVQLEERIETATARLIDEARRKYPLPDASPNEKPGKVTTGE